MTLPSRFIAIVLVLILAVGGFGQQPAPAGLPDPRTIVAVLDLTPSFRYTAESVSKIKGIVRALGPGDTFLLLTLGGDFSPARDVAIQCIMPRMDPGLFAPAHSIREWQERQARIAAVWAASTQRQAAVLAALDQPFPQLDKTPLYQLLEYVSHWFASTPAGSTRTLLIFSDLEHDYSGLRSPLPPKAKMPFGGVSVTAAFVPWGAAWASREQAWRGWFSPAGFAMLDEASARVAVLVPPSAIPHQAAKVF